MPLNACCSAPFDGMAQGTPWPTSMSQGNFPRRHLAHHWMLAKPTAHTAYRMSLAARLPPRGTCPGHCRRLDQHAGNSPLRLPLLPHTVKQPGAVGNGIAVCSSRIRRHNGSCNMTSNSHLAKALGFKASRHALSNIRRACAGRHKPRLPSFRGGQLMGHAIPAMLGELQPHHSLSMTPWTQGLCYQGMQYLLPAWVRLRIIYAKTLTSSSCCRLSWPHDQHLVAAQVPIAAGHCCTLAVQYPGGQDSKGVLPCLRHSHQEVLLPAWHTQQIGAGVTVTR